MKKLLTLLTLLSLLLTLSACAKPNSTPITDSQPTTTEDLPVSEVPTEPVTEPTTPSESPKPADFKLDIKDKTNLSLTNVTDSELAFTSYTVRGTVNYENDVIYPDLFIDDSMLCIYGSYQDQSIPNGTAKVCSYDFTTKEKKEHFSYTYNIYEAMLVELNGYVFVAPCNYDENNNLVMSLLCYDLESGQPKILDEFEVKIPAADIKVLGDSEVLFFVYRKLDGKSVDTIYRYNTETNELSIYYEDFTDEWDDLTLTSKNILAMDTSGEQVYILKYQSIDNKMVYALEIRDADGNIVKEYSLNALDSLMISDSRIKGYYIEEFWCLNDYLLFKLYYDGEYPTKYNVWEYRLCKISGDGVIDLKLDKYKPTAATPSVSDNGEFLLMGSDSPGIDLLLLDTLNDELVPVAYSVEEPVSEFFGIKCNESGQVLVVGESIGLKSRYLYSFSISK